MIGKKSHTFVLHIFWQYKKMSQFFQDNIYFEKYFRRQRLNFLHPPGIEPTPYDWEENPHLCITHLLSRTEKMSEIIFCLENIYFHQYFRRQ